jgi:adenylate cyclase
MKTESVFEKGAVRSVLENILASPQFISSPQVSATLRYVVEETLEDRSNRIKAYSIAIDVLEKTEEFDPSANPIVRVLAGRLREALAGFYESTAGLEQPIVITVPKGSYVPVFAEPLEITQQAADAHDAEAENAPTFSRTVAIEKFDVFSGETASESTDVRSDLVSEGLQVELIDKLSRFKDFIIMEASPDISGSNVFLLKKKSAEYSLSGKIRISEARIIVTPVLRRCADNAIIWSKTYDELFQNTDALFDIKAMIAADVAATLGQPYGTIVTKIAASRPRLGDMRMDHYLALVRFYQYSNDKTDENFEGVLAGLEAATSEVPEFSSAWAALSWMYADEKFKVNKTVDPKESLAKALGAAQKAVYTDPENAMAHQYLAIAKFNDGDSEGFRKAARIALRLNPNDAEVLADMGSHFIQLDNSIEGKEMVEKAMELSPGHPPWYHFSIAMYHYTRKEAALAVHHARQLLQEGSLSAYILLTASLVQDGQMAEAKDTYQLLLETRPVFASNYQSILGNWPLPDGMREMLLLDLEAAGLQALAVKRR